MEENTKQCSKCKLEKNFSEFNKCAAAKFGIHNHCRECQKDTRREWYLKNKDAELEKSKEYSRTEKCIENRKARYIENKELLLFKNRKRRASPHARNLANQARNKIYNNDANFRLSVSLRSKVASSIIKNRDTESSLYLLGCSSQEARDYLESKFTKDMSWTNYGRNGWHIDHIVPCSSFNLIDTEEQKKCFHYTNMQPLWWIDNISKGNKKIELELAINELEESCNGKNV